ncbi:MAG: nucleotidyltransferase family protein, partial [Clostridiales bacterium]|nr:nucleotidyltransferase family protein [Clostridiales bacterium]
NILAIEYLKAIRRQNSTMIPWPIHRQGDPYNSTSLDQKTYDNASESFHTECSASVKIYESFASALAIRNAVRNSEIDSVLPFVPETAREMLVSAYRDKSFLLTEDLDMVLFYALLSADENALINCAAINDEMRSRIFRLLNQYRGFEQYTALCSSKTVPRSQTRRALLHILLKTRKAPPEAMYARILGFRKDASGLLTEIHRAASAPVISKLAAGKNLLTEEQAEALSDTIHAANLYEACISQKSNKPFINEYTKPIVII